MAYEVPVGTATFPATTGLSQYRFVFINSSGKLTKPSSNGRVLGVLVSSGTTGTNGAKAQTVQLYGIAKVVSGSTAIAVGDTIGASTATGRAVAKASGDVGVGIALVAGVSTSTHEVLSVLLTGPFASSTAF